MSFVFFYLCPDILSCIYVLFCYETDHKTQLKILLLMPLSFHSVKKQSKIISGSL